MERFKGKSVLVTGGATGIGRAAALAFAREGAHVMIGDVDVRVRDTAEFIDAHGGSASFLRTDVARGSDNEALVAACASKFGGMHIAFNNAGVLPPPLPFHEVPESDFERIIAVDLKGVFLCMQAQIRHFLAHSGGAIVNTASVAGIVATPMTQAWLDDSGFREAFFAQSAIGRAADAEEIAGAVLYLASDAASFTNGTVLVVDGGQTAH